MTFMRTCDICRIPHLTTKRYGVTRQRKSNRGGFTTYGAGGIDLCDPCWTHACQPKMVAARSRTLRSATGRNPEVSP